jgi:hypothetical protein
MHAAAVIRGHHTAIAACGNHASLQGGWLLTAGLQLDAGHKLTWTSRPPAAATAPANPDCKRSSSCRRRLRVRYSLQGNTFAMQASTHTFCRSARSRRCSSWAASRSARAMLKLRAADETSSAAVANCITTADLTEVTLAHHSNARISAYTYVDSCGIDIHLLLLRHAAAIAIIAAVGRLDGRLYLLLCRLHSMSMCSPRTSRWWVFRCNVTRAACQHTQTCRLCCLKSSLACSSSTRRCASSILCSLA